MQHVRLLAFLGVLLALLAEQCATRENPSKQRGGAAAAMGEPALTHFTINRLATSFWSDGASDVYRGQPGSTGLVYPKGSARSAIFQTGFWWGAYYGDELRVGGIYWNSGLQPGKILSTQGQGDTLVAEDPNGPLARIFRVRRDLPPGSKGDVSDEQAEAEGTAQQILDQYHKDWLEWPAERGAPFEDRDSNGLYDPSMDIPGVAGADQTIWLVANDLNPGLTPTYWACLPMGIELQLTVWGYKRDDPLGNMLFRRYFLINKSRTALNDMYVAPWVDPDLGYSLDDMVGCDTARSLGFVYNGQQTDKTYSPLPPPAVGFDFFQGPVVEGEPSDSAIFRGKRVYGKKNLPMSSFFAFDYTTPDPVYHDPPYLDSTAIPMYYNLMKGLTKFGDPWIDPSGKPSRFPFSGDPATQSGWLDGQLFPAGDRRFGLGSGPFTMAPGDSQEIVIAEIAAGAETGIDRLAAVSLLKNYDDFAQVTYDNLFELPSAPHAPSVIASALDGAIVLSWGEDQASVSATEGFNDKGYTFQGYNVYQLPRASSALSEGKRIATFDIVDGVQKIWDKRFDPASGEQVTVVVQQGTDSGIQRFLRVSTDPFTNGNPMVNGTPYHFAVTSYNYNLNPVAVPVSLENALDPITITPQGAQIGSELHAEAGQVLTHSRGSDDAFRPEILDPTRITGQNYSVAVNGTGAAVTSWSLIRGTADTVVNGSTTFAGDEASPLADGILWRLQNPAEGPRRDTQPLPRGWDYLPSANVWSIGVGSGFQAGNNSVVYPNDISLGLLGRPRTTVTPDSLKKVEIRFGQLQKAYRYVKNYTTLPPVPARDPSFGPFLLKRGPGHVYQGDYATVTVPFTVWEIDSLDGDPLPRQLNVGFLENNDSLYDATGAYMGKGEVNGKWEPTTFPETGGLEAIYVFASTYSETEQAKYNASMLNPTSVDLYYIVHLAKENSASLWKDGDKVVLTPNYVLVGGRTFMVSTQAQAPITSSPELAKSQMDLVNVFPNPYYGVNPLELDKYYRFVTFSHLPRRATIRIFNLGGVMVRRIDKDGDSQFQQWDLKNEEGMPVGSGLYIAHIDLPDMGASKIVKIAVVQEQQILDRY